MYDVTHTEASKGALVEIVFALNQYEDDYVLCGGWAPYFLSLGHMEHCGSIDIDLVLSPSIVKRYESIRKIFTNLDYSPTDNPFRFERELVDLNSAPFSIHIDLLSEPDAEKYLAPFIQVQEDLSAVLIPGCSIALRYNFMRTVTGIIPSGGIGSADVRITDVVSTLTMKGLALGRPGKLEKDSYDIYTVAGFHRGNPRDAALSFVESIEDHDGDIPDVTQTAIDRIRRGFESSDHFASLAVSRFVDYNISVDASERVSAFLTDIDAHFRSG